MNGFKEKLQNKRGMTLVEVLVAMAILVLIIITFTPLFANYYRNIHTAGEVNKNTYEKASLIERVLANKGDHLDSYESRVSDVPITMSVKDASGNGVNMNVKDTVHNTTTEQIATVSFGTSDEYQVTGMTVTSNYKTGGLNNYASFYSDSEGAGLYCFPSTITDDFVTKDIYLVLTGGDDDRFKGSLEEISARLTVKYTDENGNRQVINKNDGYYTLIDVEEDKTVLRLQIKGGNNVICFQNSPLIFEYSHYAPLTVEVGAPEIIMVGEKASDGKYYYYATQGVDKNGNLELVAKTMPDTANLTSAMNDVEWVAEGRGDDGSTTRGVNTYGYYVMGGDAGQVRRFWRNETTGNYYWGGDDTIDYYRYLNINNNTVQSGSSETMTNTITGTSIAARTSATSMRTRFVNIFNSNPDKNYYPNYTADSANNTNDYGFSLNAISVNTTGLTNGYHYELITADYATANLSNTDQAKYTVSLGNVFKWIGWFNVKYRYYGPVDGVDEINQLSSKISGSNALLSHVNVDGFQEATNYEYKNDTSLITITSVGAIQITNNAFVIQDDTWDSSNSDLNKDVYPTKSYSLYCGYIPATMSVYGRHYNKKLPYMYLGTIGLAYSQSQDKWYPVGQFGDVHTADTSYLNSTLFGSSVTWRQLLRYYDSTDTFRDANDSVFPISTTKTFYNAGAGNAGVALAGQGNDYYITDGKTVDVTIGYLSNPYALSLSRTTAPIINGVIGSDFYLTDNLTKVGSGYNHAFYGTGLRDFVTMLDVKSFYDDLTKSNFSMAVGYTLSFLANDYSNYTRMGQVFNNGVVYIRATGDGTDNDTAGSIAVGKGWSLKQESNIFHEFYSIAIYADEGNSVAYRTGLGWNTIYHRSYLNTSRGSGAFGSTSAVKESNSPGREEGSPSYGLNTHILAQTECNCVNWGTTWDTKPQAMWGTENGTLMSWFYNYEGKKDIKSQNYEMTNETYSKVNAVVKEYESYMWADRYGSSWKGSTNLFYDYGSVNAGISNTYGFISVLKTVNDIAFGGDQWVAVGDWSGKNPKDYCASASCYTNDGTGSYVNVKYLPDTYEEDDDANNDSYYAWKAVNFSNDHINIVSVTYCENIWYITGYHDNNGNGEYDAGEKGVIYYARNPLLVDNGDAKWNGGWRQGALNNGNTVAYFYSPDETGTITTGDYKGFKMITLEGVNSMASQG